MDRDFDLRSLPGLKADVYSSSEQEIIRLNEFMDEIILSHNPVVFKSICLSLFSCLSSFSYIAAFRGKGSLDRKREPFLVKYFSFFGTMRSNKGFMEIIDLCCDPEYMVPLHCKSNYPEGNHLVLSDEDYAAIKEFQEYYRNKIIHPVASSAVLDCNWFLISEILSVVKVLALEIENPIYKNPKVDKVKIREVIEEIESKLPSYEGGGIKSL